MYVEKSVSSPPTHLMWTKQANQPVLKRLNNISAWPVNMLIKPDIFAFCGLIASGKSTLAAAWAEHIEAPCHNSDWIRKELAGLLPQTSKKESFNQGIYTPEFSQKTYNTLLERGKEDLKAGKKVVLDASFQEIVERKRVMNLAQSLNKKAVFILCQCPEEIMKERMDNRAKDPLSISDGRWEIYLKQKEKHRHPDELTNSELLTIKTNKPVSILVSQLMEIFS